MKPLLTLTLLTFSIQSLFAQKETINWFYGNNSGNTFVNGNFQNVPGIPYGPYFYSTSYSDANGNLKFIFNGSKVLDRNYNTMPGSALFPMQNYVAWGNHILLTAASPGNANQFYLFYASNSVATGNCLRWAMVDMSLNGGLGQVISADNVIDNFISPAFTLVRKKGSADFWVVTHKQGTDIFNSRLVTAAGISTTPVVSQAGTNASKAQYVFADMKTSPNGEMIAGITHYYSPGIFSNYVRFVEVFNIDGQTGILSNKVRSASEAYVYNNGGFIEFSPDNRLLYAVYTYGAQGLQPCGFGASHLMQYNLCYTDSASFSRYAPMVYGTFSWCYIFLWEKIRMGPDKKLYLRYGGTNTISVINNPNIIGAHCGINFNAYNTADNNSYSLPDFYHAYMEKAVKNNIVYSGCYPNPMHFKITNDTITNVQWNFGDAASGGSNTSASTEADHVFTAPGFYTVTANLYASSGAFIETVSTLVEIKDPNKRLLYGFPKDTVLCAGANLKFKFDVINGIYAWSHTTPYGSYFDGVSDSMTISSTGKYYVEMRQNDCNGCIMKDSINLTVLPTPNFSLGPDVSICTGDSLKLTPYVSGADFLWNTGAQTSFIYAKSAGSYWVRAEYNHNGCPQSDTIVITQKPGVTFSLPNDTTLCNNQTLLLNPGISNATYQWQNFSTANSYNVTTPGKYWVQVTAANGCIHSDTVVVSYVNAQAIYLGADTTLCAGDSIKIGAIVSGSNYLWNTGATDSLVTIKNSGEYWVKVNNGLCSVADTINISFNPVPVFNLGNDTAICEKSKLLLNTNVSNAGYLWQDGSKNNSFIATTAGTYWAKVTQKGCSFSDTLQLATKPVPLVFLGNDTTICNDATLLLHAASTQPATYTWQDNSTSNTYLADKQGTYWVNATSLNNCSYADTITVYKRPLPDFTLGNDTSLCDQQKLTYNFTLPAATYIWSTGNTKGQQIINEPGNYWLQVSQQGCSKSDTITVLYKPLPQVALGNDTTLCEGTNYQLNAHSNGNVTYTWQNNSTDATYAVTQPGNYWVRVTLNGCSKADTIKIAYLLKPVFDLGHDTTICKRQILTLRAHADGAASYVWQNGSTGSDFNASDPGTYTVTATNECGSKTDKIVITQGLCLLMLPNAFTPNHDGVNDVFRIKFPWYINEFHIMIFNRWGEKVYESRNANQGWDGTYKGTYQPTDTYVWVISLTDKDGQQQSGKGTVTLLR